MARGTGYVSSHPVVAPTTVNTWQVCQSDNPPAKSPHVYISAIVFYTKGDLSALKKQFLLSETKTNVFISDMGDGMDCTLSTLADNSKLSNAVDRTEGRDAVQRDLDRSKSGPK